MFPDPHPSTTRALSAGCTLFRSGEDADAVFFVAKGRLVTRPPGQGVGVYGVGDILGSEACLNRTPHPVPRLVVQHASSGIMLVRVAGAVRPIDTVQVLQGDSIRRLGFVDGLLTEVSVRGVWPGIGSAVSRLSRDRRLKATERAWFQQQGELKPPTVAPRLVCVCAGVDEEDIQAACQAGARTTAAVMARLCGGPGCGQCADRLSAIVHATVPPPPDAALVPVATSLAPPMALGEAASIRRGWRRLPLIGDAAILYGVITDPLGLVQRAREALGPAVKIPIPTRFELVYLGDDVFNEVLDLPASVAQMGPVMGNVPTIGFWFPRGQQDHDSLQTLLLRGREIIASLVRAAMANDHIDACAAGAVDRHLSPRQGDIDDLFSPVAALFSDAAASALVGDKLWGALRDPCLALLRDIHDGIDIPRATLAVTPFYIFMREYRATRAIEGPLRAVIAAHRQDGRFPVLDQIFTDRQGPIAPEDEAWMLLYVLWNATIYPGSYGAWTFADALTQSEWHAGVRGLSTAARRRAYERAFLETTRMWPIGSLVRALAEDVTLESGGCPHTLKKGQVVGVFPWGRNHDPARFPDPDQWKPDRWLQDASPHGLFGRGAFGCVAVSFNCRLFGATLDTMFTKFRFTPGSAPPPRRCRVHLTYPDTPWPGAMAVIP